MSSFSAVSAGRSRPLHCIVAFIAEFVIITFKIRKNKAKNDDNLQLVMSILFLFFLILPNQKYKKLKKSKTCL
jgi:ABC-type uncharacterized transport system permease subunit